MTVKQSTPPLVSIIMPAYNAARYIRESIDSVLRQDFSDFELIIINDGSTDDTQSIINQYSKIDNRIRPLHQKNIGLVETLNKGIRTANGKYIARIDADDPWFDSKLARQIQLLKQDRLLVLIGGGFEIIDEDGYFIETIFPPTCDEDIRRTMMLRNPFGHAGVVYTKEAALKAGLYSGKYGPTEDYELWIRLAKIGRLANVPEVVYRYRINQDGISQTSSTTQATETKKHIDKLWLGADSLRVLSRNELVKQSQYYISTSSRRQYGVALKEQFLSDNAQIGVKLIKYGHLYRGVRQIVSVALTGRTGMKIALKRLHILKLRKS